MKSFSRYVLLATIVFATLVESTAPALLLPRAYLESADYGTITQVDLSRRTVVNRRQLSIPANPQAVAISADAQSVYVTNGRVITVIDATRRAITATLIPEFADSVVCGISQLVLTPDGKKLLASTAGSAADYHCDSLLVFDRTSNHLEQVIPLPQSPSFLAIAPSGIVVVLTNSRQWSVQSQLVFIDLDSQVTTALKLPVHRTSLSLAVDSNVAYVLMNDGYRAFDLQSTHLLRHFPRVGGELLYAPWKVAVSRDGSKLYELSFYDSEGIEGFHSRSTVDGTPLSTRRLHAGTFALGHSGRVYLTDSQSLIVFDPAQDLEIARYPVQGRHLAVSDDETTALLSNGVDTVTAFDLTSGNIAWELAHERITGLHVSAWSKAVYVGVQPSASMRDPRPKVLVLDPLTLSTQATIYVEALGKFVDGSNAATLLIAANPLSVLDTSSRTLRQTTLLPLDPAPTIQAVTPDEAAVFYTRAAADLDDQACPQLEMVRYNISDGTTDVVTRIPGPVYARSIGTTHDGAYVFVDTNLFHLPTQFSCARHPDDVRCRCAAAQGLTIANATLADENRYLPIQGSLETVASSDNATLYLNQFTGTVFRVRARDLLILSTLEIGAHNAALRELPSRSELYSINAPSSSGRVSCLTLSEHLDDIDISIPISDFVVTDQAQVPCPAACRPLSPGIQTVNVKALASTVTNSSPSTN